jgi:acyl-coenzyme A synthetase/AMP-(fatty) acid ligase
MIKNEAIYELSSIQMKNFGLSITDPFGTQKKILRNIINKNRYCIFGKDHQFSKIISIDDFRNSVSINSYNDLLPYINRCESQNSILTEENIIYWAKTSGTSGTAKLIPHT